MKMPCELVVKYILPALRALIAKELIEKYGYSQLKVARMLSTSQSSISYYLNSKRGNKFLNRIKDAVREDVDEIVESLIAGAKAKELLPKFCKVCFKLRTNNIICKLHKKQVELPEACDVCLIRPVVD